MIATEKETMMIAKPLSTGAPIELRAARRINRSLTAALEKRALNWIAARAPCWVTSDQLTLLGFAAQIGAGLCYAWSASNRSALLLASLFLALNWLGDSLDGTLARARRQERPRYGFYVDHMVDIFGSAALMCGLGYSGFLHWQIAAAMLVAFLILSSESYLSAYSLLRFELSQGIFGPTEIRILLVAGNLALLRSPWSMLFGRRFLLFDLGGVIATVCMVAMAVAVTARHTAQLYHEEPLPNLLRGSENRT